MSFDLDLSLSTTFTASGFCVGLGVHWHRQNGTLPQLRIGTRGLLQGPLCLEVEEEVSHLGEGTG